MKGTSRRQLEAFLDWVPGNINAEDEIWLLEDGKNTRAISFSFPLDLRCPRWRTKSPSEPTFIVGDRPPSQFPQGVWHQIFDTDGFCVFENTKRPFLNGKEPIRFGFTDYEKKALLTYAQKTLADGVRGEDTEPIRALEQIPTHRLYSLTTVDVSLWVGGALRGSYVIENAHLVDAIRLAARSASVDFRFKPITEAELPSVDIEIAVMHAPAIPWGKDSYTYPESNKWYRFQKGERKGFFVPGVLNMIRFSEPEAYWKKLFEEKAGVPWSEKDMQYVLCGETDIFSGKAQKDAITFVGTSDTRRPEESFTQSIEKVGEGATEWMLAVQDEDGYFPATLDPGRPFWRHFELIRSVFAAGGLATFSKAVGNARYREATEKFYTYAQTFTEQRRVKRNPLFYSYMGILANQLGHEHSAHMFLNEALRLCELGLGLSPLVRAQVGALSFELLQTVPHSLWEPLSGELSGVKKRNTGIEIVLWAEYAHLAFKIENNHEPIDWLLSFQNEDGSFSTGISGMPPYTRATGKFFEVLAGMYPTYKNETEKAFSWLKSHQYDEGRLLFVPSDSRERTRGGFCYDDYNNELWVDVVGHVLLGVGRLLYLQK